MMRETQCNVKMNGLYVSLSMYSSKKTFSDHSEAFASELSENLEEMFSGYT